MGCDIHMVLEVRYEGNWVGLYDYPYHDAEAFSFYEDPPKQKHIGS